MVSKRFFTRMERRTHARFGIEIRLVNGEAGSFESDEPVMLSFASGLGGPSGSGIHNDVFRLWHFSDMPVYPRMSAAGPATSHSKQPQMIKSRCVRQG